MRLTLTYPDRSKIEARLHQVCKRPEGSEFAVYAWGYDDEQVAKEMTEALGKQVTKTHVSGIRKPIIGPLREARTPAAKSADAEMNEIREIWGALRGDADEHVLFRQAINRIEKRLDALERRLHSQSDMLAVG